MMWKRTILLLCTLGIVSTFNIKEMLFGNKQDDTAASNEESTATSFGTPVMLRTDKRADIPCDHYICKDTDTCVSSPSDCPCRLKTDKKCLIGDWYICIRGDQTCRDEQ